MVFAVVFLVGGEVGDAEVRTKIDHAFTAGDERLGVGRGRAVRQREEKQVDVAGSERDSI